MSTRSSINSAPSARQQASAVVRPSAAISVAQISSLKILELGTAELSDFVTQALVQNPFLLSDHLPGQKRLPPSRLGPPAYSGATDYEVEQLTARPEGLFAALTRQIDALRLGKLDRTIALALLEGLDDDGYYRGHLFSRANSGLAPRLEAILSRLQRLEPLGVFSRSVGEFFALQLRAEGRYDDAFAVILNALDLLAEHGVAAVADAYGIAEKAVEDRIRILKTLRRAPAEGMVAEPAAPVFPELSVFPGKHGRWDIAFLDAGGGKVRVDRRLHDHAVARTGAPTDIAFVRRHWREALSLVDALERRARTLTAIAEMIVSRQSAYLSGAQTWRNGLLMREVAASLGIHESTVSRAVGGKFMTCPIGTVELRSLFESSHRRSDPGAEPVSEGQVKTALGRLIKDEYHPLSDVQLSDLLSLDGLPVARRTVAKYRTEMGIPTSRERAAIGYSAHA